jgi:hypothetical protein
MWRDRQVTMASVLANVAEWKHRSDELASRLATAERTASALETQLAAERQAEARAKTAALAATDAETKAKLEATTAGDAQAKLAIERQSALEASNKVKDEQAKQLLALTEQAQATASKLTATEAEKAQLAAERDAQGKAKTEALVQRDEEAKAKTEALAARDAEAKAKQEAVTARDAQAKLATERQSALEATSKVKDEQAKQLLALTEQAQATARKLTATEAEKAQLAAERDAQAKAKTEALSQRDAEAKAKTEALAARDAEAKGKLEAIAACDGQAKLATERLAAFEVATKAKDEQSKQLLALTRQAQEATEKITTVEAEKTKLINDCDVQGRAKVEAMAARDTEIRAKAEAIFACDVNAKLAAEHLQQINKLKLMAESGKAQFELELTTQRNILTKEIEDLVAAREAEKKAYAQEKLELIKVFQEKLEHEYAWLAHSCIVSDDIHQSAQKIIITRKLTDKSLFSFLIELSDQLENLGDKTTALSYINQCRKLPTSNTVESLTEITRRLIRLGQPTEAESVFVQAALAGKGVLSLSEKERIALKNANLKLHQLAGQKTEHGHDLLISELNKNLSTIVANISGRKPVLVEIGTTREDVPGQGSTQKLADYCKINAIDFITVDMDPHNSAMAEQTFASMEVLSFQAVTSKGEEYLRNYDGMIDFIFLDAYDFDHGKHSELRQSRYEKYLGSRIDELECHRMHLDCAQTVAKKLSPFGLVCFDDTWLENGKWTAKGTLGMPYLLANGFELIEARNHAALLRRKPFNTGIEST